MRWSGILNPNLPAIAVKWMTALVDPPSASKTRIAFSTDSFFVTVLHYSDWNKSCCFLRLSDVQWLLGIYENIKRRVPCKLQIDFTNQFRINHKKSSDALRILYFVRIVDTLSVHCSKNNKFVAVKFFNQIDICFAALPYTSRLYEIDWPRIWKIKHQQTSYRIQMSHFVHETRKFNKLSDNRSNMVGEKWISINIQTQIITRIFGFYLVAR